MNDELIERIRAYNRKAEAAERDGYYVDGGYVWEPRPGCRHEKRRVCRVEDYGGK